MVPRVYMVILSVAQTYIWWHPGNPLMEQFFMMMLIITKTLGIHFKPVL
jgi:hypothetical protein